MQLIETVPTATTPIAIGLLNLFYPGFSDTYRSIGDQGSGPIVNAGCLVAAGRKIGIRRHRSGVSSAELMKM